MSDPMNRPPGDPVVQPPPESLPRKSASPLIWLLLLFALLALGWYLYSRRGVDVVVPDAVPPAVDSSAGSDPAGGIASDDDREGRRAKPEPAAKARIPKTRVAADREASPIARPQPDYPREAMRRGDEGTVVVLAEIDVNGVPTSVEVADRSGSRELDRSAVDAVRKWRFTPAMKDGRKVASTVRIPVEFKRERQ